MPIVTDHSALLGGNYWNGIEVTGRPVLVTYSFPAAAPAYDAGVAGFSAATVASFQAFSAAQQTQARAALAEWAAASGIVFIEAAPGQGDINFQIVDFNTTPYAGAGGIAFEPFGDWNFFSYPQFIDDLDAAGDVFMNAQAIAGGVIDAGTLRHEIGHAIGLKHPTEVRTNFAAEPDVVHDQVLSADDPLLTIMATVGGTAALKQLDRDAAAFLYGATGGAVVTADAAGSNAVVSSWSWNAAGQLLTQIGFDNALVPDTIRGSSVGDVILGLSGDDRLFGLAGIDTLDGGAGDDRIFGGSGDDILYGSAGTDSLYGGAGIDKLKGGGEGDTIFGDDGNDIIEGQGGTNLMIGGAGNDLYYVEGLNDRIVEAVGEGSDAAYVFTDFTLEAGSELEWLIARAPGLIISGNELANRLNGDPGADTLDGGGGADQIYGGAGNDMLLFGGAGNDLVFGEAGDDTLRPGLGFDQLIGGAGNDSFRFEVTEFENRMTTGLYDNIYDYSRDAGAPNLDTIRLQGAAADYLFQTTSSASWLRIVHAATGGTIYVTTAVTADAAVLAAQVEYFV